MQTSPAPWIEALRHSHDALRAAAEPLGPEELEGRSYAAEWSIAQVLSHLGSQAEIFGLFIDAGLSGQEPPGREAFTPIWAVWDAKSAREQADDALRADEAIVIRLEALDGEQLRSLRLRAFGTDLDAAGLARLRLSEHALHSWDVEVALNPAATLAPDAVDLLVDTLGPLAARSGKPAGRQLRVRISTTSPVRHFMLDVGETVTLTPTEGDSARPELALPAEALVRLVYGRLDPAHTPPVESRNVDLDELRQVFPGF